MYAGVAAASGMAPRQAFLLAVLAESIIVGGLVLYIMLRPPQLPNEIIPISLEIMEDKPELAPEPEKKPEIKPALIPPPPRLPRVQPVTPPASEPVPQVATPVAPVTPAPLAAAPSPIAPPAAAPSPPPPPATSKSDPNAEYAAKVKAAVQAALIFPPAAAAMDFQGRAHVEFKLRDRVPGGARILSSSGMGLTDRAALQSVEAAQYPVPPKELQGKEATYQVWVEFHH
jgi:protein TonB